MASHFKQKNTAYWIHNDDRKLPTIVMIHGFRGTHHGLELIAENMSDFRVIIPDLPGFGESQSMAGGHDISNYVEWLYDFIKNLNLTEPPILLGHSFGSIVTSCYVSKFPKTISKLILVNPIGYPALNGPKAILSKLSLLYYQIGQKLPAKLGKIWLSSRLVILVMSSTMAKSRNLKMRRYIHGQHFRHFNSFANKQSVTEAFRASIQHNVREYAAGIPNPTLIIAGDRDDITPIEKQYELAEIFPNAEIEVLEKVGHLTHYEKPMEVANKIKKFLR